MSTEPKYICSEIYGRVEFDQQYRPYKGGLGCQGRKRVYDGEDRLVEVTDWEWVGGILWANSSDQVDCDIRALIMELAE